MDFDALRDELEAWVTTPGVLDGYNRGEGACLWVPDKLTQQYGLEATEGFWYPAHRMSLENAIEEGYVFSHCWNYAGDVIVDATAGQFFQDGPIVAIIQPGNDHYACYLDDEFDALPQWQQDEILDIVQGSHAGQMWRIADAWGRDDMPQALYHASVLANLQPGDTLLPSSEIGQAANFIWQQNPDPTMVNRQFDDGSVHHYQSLVWLEEDPEGALEWAAHSLLKWAPKDFQDAAPVNGGLGGIAVYRVEPIGWVGQPTIRHSDGEWACERAKVLERVQFEEFQLEDYGVGVYDDYDDFDPWGNREAAADDHAQFPYIARGIFYEDSVPRPLANKMRDGTVTADDVLSLITEPAGHYWGILERDYGLEDIQDFATGGYGSEELVSQWIDDDDYEDTGQLEVVLVAKRPEGWDPQDNPDEVLMGNSYVDPGTQLELTEVMYNAGWGWQSLPTSRTITADVKGIPLEQLWESNKGNIVIVTDLKAVDPATVQREMVRERQATFQLASALIEYDTEIGPAIDQVTQTATDYMQRLNLDLQGPFYLIGNARNHAVLAQKQKWIEPWGAPKDDVEWSAYSTAEPLPTFWNTLQYGDNEDLRKIWAEQIIDVPYDDSLFGDIKSGDTVTIYRGLSLRPEDNPATVEKPNPSSWDGSDQGGGGLGASWTLLEETAMAIAGRGMAGFQGENNPTEPQHFMPKNVLRDRDNQERWKDKRDRPPVEVMVPTVLRAEVVLDEGERDPNRTRDGGPERYRPWNWTYRSEMEVDVPRGSEITLTGYKQAKPVPISQAEYEQAMEKHERYKQVHDDPENWVTEDRDAGYWIRWEWGDWVEINVKRTAAQAPDFEWGGREKWEPGDRAFFEYHCLESPDSADAEAWYRSHQPVTVLGADPDTEAYREDLPTHPDRAEAGQPLIYRVRWDDGFEYDVWEDELLIDPKFYERPDPPTHTADVANPEFLTALEFTVMEDGSNTADQTRRIQAVDPTGAVVGEITVYGRYYKKARGRIEGIYVQPEYQRRGVATALFEQAQIAWPDLKIQHSEDRTDDGNAWAKAVGGPLPRRNRASASPDDVWQCDGCGLTGTEAEVERHVMDSGTKPDGTLKDAQDITCWGAMQVGGPAWEAYTFHDVHPMSILVQDVRDIMGDHEAAAPAELATMDERSKSMPWAVNKAWLQPDGTWMLVPNDHSQTPGGSPLTWLDRGWVRFYVRPGGEAGIEMLGAVTPKQAEEIRAVLEETRPKEVFVTRDYKSKEYKLHDFLISLGDIDLNTSHIAVGPVYRTLCFECADKVQHGQPEGPATDDTCSECDQFKSCRRYPVHFDKTIPDSPWPRYPKTSADELYLVPEFWPVQGYLHHWERNDGAITYQFEGVYAAAWLEADGTMVAVDTHDEFFGSDEEAMEADDMHTPWDEGAIRLTIPRPDNRYEISMDVQSMATAQQITALTQLVETIQPRTIMVGDLKGATAMSTDEFLANPARALRSEEDRTSALRMNQLQWDILRTIERDPSVQALRALSNSKGVDLETILAEMQRMRDAGVLDEQGLPVKQADVPRYVDARTIGTILRKAGFPASRSSGTRIRGAPQVTPGYEVRKYLPMPDQPNRPNGKRVQVVVFRWVTNWQETNRKPEDEASAKEAAMKQVLEDAGYVVTHSTGGWMVDVPPESWSTLGRVADVMQVPPNLFLKPTLADNLLNEIFDWIGPNGSGTIEEIGEGKSEYAWDNFAHNEEWNHGTTQFPVGVGVLQSWEGTAESGQTLRVDTDELTQADDEYPIHILQLRGDPPTANSEGPYLLVDGRHRYVKAYADGEKTVTAVVVHIDSFNVFDPGDSESEDEYTLGEIVYDNAGSSLPDLRVIGEADSAEAMKQHIDDEVLKYYSHGWWEEQPMPVPTSDGRFEWTISSNSSSELGHIKELLERAGYEVEETAEAPKG